MPNIHGSVTTRLIASAIVSLALVLLGTAPASAGSRLPPLNSIHGAAFPSAGLQDQDSCSMNQYNNSKLPSVFEANVRGFRVNLIGPVMWSCGIEDGDGSGAGISFTASSVSNPTKNSILLISSANVVDNGGNFCPYTSEALPSWTSQSCDGKRTRPADEEVKYIYGSSHTKSFVVLVAVPAGVKTPWIGLTAEEPTVTVLATSKVGQGAYTFVCSIGRTISPLCITDAKQFADEYWYQF